MRKILIIIISLLGLIFYSAAQQFNGTSGMIQIPTAEMHNSGDARIGVHFIPNQMTPDCNRFKHNGKPYHTMSYSLSITPFSWIEIGYTCNLLRGKDKDTDSSFGGYTSKDRYFSLKLRPLKEGKWWPAIAVGGYDFFDSRAKLSGEGGELYWGNFYGAATKHFLFSGHEVAVHAAYRHYRRDYNHRWQGVVGGVSYRPAFAPNLRLMVEYTGNEVNAGIDCLLFRHWLIQAAVWNGRQITGGICYQLNLF